MAHAPNVWHLTDLSPWIESEGAEKAGERGVYGGIVHSIPLIDLLQLLHMSRASAIVKIEPSEGAVYFDKGEIVHAVAGSQQGWAALGGLISQRGGFFETDELPRPYPTTVDAAFEGLLLDLVREADEAAAVARTACWPSGTEIASCRPVSLEEPSPSGDGSAAPGETSRPQPPPRRLAQTSWGIALAALLLASVAVGWRLRGARVWSQNARPVLQAKALSLRTKGHRPRPRTRSVRAARRTTSPARRVASAEPHPGPSTSVEQRRAGGKSRDLKRSTARPKCSRKCRKARRRRRSRRFAATGAKLRPISELLDPWAG